MTSPHQGGVQRPAAADDQDPPVAALREHRFEQGVVLEAAHGADPAGEFRAATELAELGIAAADVLADLIDEIGGGAEGHRLSPGAGAAAAR